MRLGINVPDDLLKRFAPIKNHIGLSELTRAAILKEVQAYELAEHYFNDLEIKDMVEQFSKDNPALSIDWEALGREDAKDWLKGRELVELRRIMLMRPSEPEDGVSEHYQKKNERLGPHRSKLYELSDSTLLDFFRPLEEAYSRGWRYTLVVAWDKATQRLSNAGSELKKLAGK